MNEYSERRKLMDNNISVELFAAYLDGNLPTEELNSIETIVSNNSELNELIRMANIIDEDIQSYIADRFIYEADMAALEDNSFEIPNVFDDFNEVDDLDFAKENANNENILDNEQSTTKVCDDTFMPSNEQSLEEFIDNQPIEDYPNIELHSDGIIDNKNYDTYSNEQSDFFFDS